MKDRDVRKLRRHTIFVRSVIILVLLFGIISLILYFDPSLINTPEEQYKGILIWLVIGIVFIGFGVFSFFFIGRWSRRLVWLLDNVVPVPMNLVLKVKEDSENTQYYAHLTPLGKDIRNQKIWRIALWGPSHENMKTNIGRDIKAQVYFDPKSGRPAVIESEFGLLWAMAGSGAVEKQD
jgi:hypothetical protein